MNFSSNGLVLLDQCEKKTAFFVCFFFAKSRLSAKIIHFLKKKVAQDTPRMLCVNFMPIGLVAAKISVVQESKIDKQVSFKSCPTSRDYP